MWGESPVSSLFLVYGTVDEDVIYSRALAVQLALFGYELTETILVLTAEGMTVIGTSKKVKFLSPLGTDPEGDLQLKFITKPKGLDPTAMGKLYQEVIDIMKKAHKGEGKPIVGFVKKATTKGKFASGLKSALGTQLTFVDVSMALAVELSVKDEAAQTCTKKAAWFATQVLKKYLLQEIEVIVDEEKVIKHSDLAEQTEDIFEEPSKVKVKLKAENLEVAYSPHIMSGGKYNLKPSAVSNDDNLHSGTVVCRLGARYKKFCANIARTYFIGPDNDHKEAYAVLTAVYAACRNTLRAGKKAKDVYEAAMKVIKARKPELAAKFTDNCGFGMGLEFKERSNVLSAKNTRILKAGMIFNLSVGFDKLLSTDPEKKKDPKTAVFSMIIADTFLVTPDTDPEVLTSAPRVFDDVSYSLDGDEGDEEQEEEVVKEKAATRGVTKDRLREDSGGLHEVQRHQRELAQKKLLQAQARLSAEKIGESFDSKKAVAEKFASYKSPAKIPSKALEKSQRIYVDPQAETVLLPIAGQMVPFHISCVKNVHHNPEAEHQFLRLTFLTPDEAGQNAPPPFANFKSQFIREVTFRSSAAGEALGKVFFDIKELRKRVQNRLKEQSTKKTLVIQENLILSKPPIAKLREISVRPSVSRRRTTGILVAHENGLRFVSSADKFKVDVIYKNVKCCFFQKAHKSINVIMHFQLHNAILLKKGKKTEWVQFFVEVVESSQDLGKRSRYGDEDGLLEEQQERRRRQRWNERFKDFSVKVERHLQNSTTQPSLEFDIPYPDLAFTGVPNRSTVEITPAVHYLVALEDTPPLCLCLNEVEIACFERVSFNLRNFDLAFIFKDFTQLVIRIDAIPAKSLDPIKSWLNNCDIVFYEIGQNMLWKNVLKTIRQDPEGFLTDGGWEAVLGDEPSDPDGEGVEESGSDFQPDASEESDDEDYDSASSEADEDDESEFDDSEDEGEDWEDLEKGAKQDDKQQVDKESEREKRERRERQGGGGSRPKKRVQPPKKRRK